VNSNGILHPQSRNSCTFMRPDSCRVHRNHDHVIRRLHHDQRVLNSGSHYDTISWIIMALNPSTHYCATFLSFSLGVQPHPRTRAESGHGIIRVVDSEVYDMWGNTRCRIRRKGRMWMSLRGRRLVLFGTGRARYRGIGRVRGHGNHSHSGSGSTSSRSRNGSSISLNGEVKDTVADARDGALSHSSLELVQTAIRSRANSSMAGQMVSSWGGISPCNTHKTL